MTSAPMKTLRKFLPLLIVTACLVVFLLLLKTKPAARPSRPKKSTVNVEAVVVYRQDYQVMIHTQGTVRPRTESTLIPQVSGRIISVAPAFRAGGFFEEGDELLRIDSSDYETSLVVSEAALAQARLLLAEEEARAEQARKDWEKLGDGGRPTALVLREPQLIEARASLASAQALLDEAHRNISRTRITAPYAGRVLEQRVDIGQFVSTGTVLARIYAVDFAEIRLPLTDRQLAFVNLPELYRGEASYGQGVPKVTLRADFGGRKHSWKGRIVRSEGAIDSRSRQLFVVAQVEDPYGRTVEDRPPLKVGLFVEAQIEGDFLRDVIVIPRILLMENRYVLVIDSQSKLRLRPVEILWSDTKNIVVREGLSTGELLCLTQVPFAIDGMAVNTARGKKKGRRGRMAGSLEKASAGSPEKAPAGKPEKASAGGSEKVPAEKPEKTSAADPIGNQDDGQVYQRNYSQGTNQPDKKEDPGNSEN